MLFLCKYVFLPICCRVREVVVVCAAYLEGLHRRGCGGPAEAGLEKNLEAACQDSSLGGCARLVRRPRLTAHAGQSLREGEQAFSAHTLLARLRYDERAQLRRLGGVRFCHQSGGRRTKPPSVW